ncbi:MAG TPA: 4-(cytidine 5'-diphospho)-2-C-methyl-D-erythritol kinase [Accumulibacter sp.]|nr:4-(cytidine 5'-diphospho)-2-C-methyl-D-erythritol kinase [Accumulibacter sp.]HMW18472.1 4-(cytidine 5'-diphospho)-2-C-methyl-D-erythritol kinase [Accumulibacter sp.]HMX21913.1 4-(cytidine 5'-diphospho)-2-C-methyl-D-erythritol kinase [Accumulibacter sp.]HNC18888.1 4-(cytidine 5'-diphospho)-2-C-methyl-D-erythritol kinase [Accumulibacter sp.]HND81003.1 4-(cytidine 5'-diphospho)-2-C-methyl-D-erythritol kinase [Accumulibacter sp.]
MNDRRATAKPIWTWDSTYPAPAKLNLFLHVVGRRADGYHLLQTLFRLVDHGDTLRFRPRDDANIGLATPLPGVSPEDDLTVRAARLLQTAAGYRHGVDIVLTKRLPLGGGLGGGSSDAATVLLALNHLWCLGLSRNELQAIGLRLGADVPFFIFGRNAFAEGVGENLQTIDLPTGYYLVVEPPVAVETKTIFTAAELRRDTPPIAAAQWQPGFGGNDLQPVAVARFPVIGEYLDHLSAIVPARMTGSGACIFAEFASRADAETCRQKLPTTWQSWIAVGLSEHPLHELARTGEALTR